MVKPGQFQVEGELIGSTRTLGVLISSITLADWEGGSGVYDPRSDR